MSGLHRHASKRMQFHDGGGRFARAPSLVAAGAVKVCEHCGQIVPRPEMVRDEASGFVDPRVPWPKSYPNTECGKELP